MYNVFVHIGVHNLWKLGIVPIFFTAQFLDLQMHYHSLVDTRISDVANTVEH